MKEDVLSVPVNFPRNTQGYKSKCSLPADHDSFISIRKKETSNETNSMTMSDHLTLLEELSLATNCLKVE